MSTVSEVLAAQLRSPGFRATEPGYDPDQVRDHLAAVAGIVTVLERRIEQTLAEAEAAESSAVRAEAHSPAPPVDDDELLTAVFEGQRRADEVVAHAEAEAVRLRREADERIAVLCDETELQRLRAAVDEARERLAETQAAVVQADDDLQTAAEETRRCRTVIGDRLAAALADLAEMEHA